MIRSADGLQQGDNLDGDVCIVGAGAAGITLALELTRLAPDLRVLLLDGGTAPRPNPDDPPREVSPSQFLYDGQMQGDMTTIRPRFLTQTCSRGLGGSTNCWGGWCRPLDEADFQGHGPYRAWPISRADLLPFYERAQKISFLDRFEYDDPRYWIDRARQSGQQLATLPDEAGAALRTVCFQGIREEKWSFFDDYRDQLAGTPNLQVVLNANLLGIDTGPGEAVTRLRLSTLNLRTLQPGVRFTATARRYVLALGGIETVRALLLSPTRAQPHGLGNNGGRVGRFFNVHPVVTSAAQVTFGSRSWTRPMRDFYAQETNFLHEPGTGAAHADPDAPGREVQPEETHAAGGAPGAAPRAEPGAFTRVWATLTPTAETLRRDGVGNFRLILRGGLDAATVDVTWEQTTEAANRVVLSGGECDVFGLPVVRLEWNLNDQDVRTYEHALLLCEAKLRAAGYLADGGRFTRTFDLADRGTWELNLPNPGDHHMGGTRMSAEPDLGVVDPDARLHAVPNLYVSSCSVWPSGGWANPTLTIVAMAARLADHLARTTADAKRHTMRIDQAILPDPQPASD